MRVFPDWKVIGSLFLASIFKSNKTLKIWWAQKKTTNNIENSWKLFLLLIFHSKVILHPILILSKIVPSISGVFLQECFFIDENPDQVNQMVNFMKMKMLGEVLLFIKKAQESPYQNVKEQASLTAFIESSVFIDEKELFNLSKKVFATKLQKERSNSSSS